MLAESGCINGENVHQADPSLPKFKEGISCASGCVMHCVGCSNDIDW